MLLAPASVGADGSSAPDAELAQARALQEAGRFDEALAVLRTLMAERVIDADAVFLFGLAAIEASRRPVKSDAERRALLDEGIAMLHSILAQRPDLVRVRLELARAFFCRGEDGLARGQFERVLTGEVPDAVKANMQGFLSRIRARRRWTAYLGASIAPDSNITGASDEETIFINLGGVDLPFERNPDEVATSGLPRDFNVSASARLRWTDHEGSFNSFTQDRPPREDLTRTLALSVFKRDFTLFGSAPQLVVTHEKRTSTARVSTSRSYDYGRTRAESRAVRQFRGGRGAQGVEDGERGVLPVEPGGGGGQAGPLFRCPG